jgi:hypothetical protein
MSNAARNPADFAVSGTMNLRAMRLNMDEAVLARGVVVSDGVAAMVGPVCTGYSFGRQ